MLLQSLLLLTLAADPFRPAFHFAPERNWMNDPNGTVYYEGEYHLFYQYNPEGNVWGHMSWGHAVSKDLLHWQHLPLALAEENGVMIFSGSAVVDKNNTSGLCKNKSCLIAIYTGHSATKQTQNIAYSNDRGRTWTKYANNPVLDLNMKDFRDPKVIWHQPTNRWVMAVALPKAHKVRFYASPNLLNWQPLSDFGPAGATSGIWECPDLFPLDNHWVLIVSLNPGGPFGGSAVQYFIGDFDGQRFTPLHTETLWADFGKDFYAATSFSDTPNNRRILLAWHSNWQYARNEPNTEFRTIQSIPRELTIKNLRLHQQPIRELNKLRHNPITLSNLTIEQANDKLKAFRSQTFDLTLDLDGLGGIHLLQNDNEKSTVGYNSDGHLFLDRSQSGNTTFHKDFTPLTSTPASGPIRIIVDRTSIELFTNQATLSNRVFPSPTSNRLTLYGPPTTRIRSLRLYQLKPSMQQPR